jgi:hypothetical protein
VRQQQGDAVGDYPAFIFPEIIEIFNRTIGQANGEFHG